MGVIKKELATNTTAGANAPAVAWSYWGILASFYLILMFRSMFQDLGTPLEVLVARVLPFTYLKLHHTIFREIVFHLIAIAGALLTVKTLRLTQEELGWSRPDRINTITRALTYGIACWALITLATIYFWIANNHILSKPAQQDAYAMLVLWPKHFKIWPIGVFTIPDILGIFPYLNSFITAPIVEELIFRGVLFAALRRKLSLGWTITFTSILDLLLHYNLPGFFFSANWHPKDTQALFNLPRFAQILSFSMAAGWLRARRASLTELTVFHSIYNFLASSLTWSITRLG
jgi:membrane protease YdiL (CAAX protease family)